MKSRRTFNLLIAIGLLTSLIAGFVAPQVTTASHATESSDVNQKLEISQTGLYIIRLTDASVAAYMGGVGNLAATSPEATGARRLDPSSTASQAYYNYLAGKQQGLLSAMQSAFGHTVQVEHQYLYALNAMAVRISHEEALRCFDMPGVTAVYPDTIEHVNTDMGPALIEAEDIWAGTTYPGLGSMGEGIIIGVIDTGINSKHSSFAETVGDYTHTNPYGVKTYHGWCATNQGFCNEKLIGAYNLIDPTLDPSDLDGHGSHVAATAAGNPVDASFSISEQAFVRHISGVAPRANLVVYKVCDTQCYSSISLDAIDLAIGTDMVDVINYSISGGSNPWNNVVDLAFLDAYAAGIFVSASAGNEGPLPGTVEHNAPWLSTVAATTHSRIYANLVDFTVEGDIETGAGIYAVPANGAILTAFSEAVIYAGDVDPENADACLSYPAKPFEDMIVLVQGGGCAIDVKLDNLDGADAIGAIIINDFSGPPIVLDAELPFDYVESISLEDGQAIIALIQGDTTALVTVSPSVALVEGNELEPPMAYEDVLASFSARGPNPFELLKPDYAAPGVNTLAAIEALPGNAERFGINNGTSMSTAHGSGAAALMVAVYPLLSPAEIRSAMTTTTDPNVTGSNGINPANYFETGTGRLALYGAGQVGLVMDESSANFLAADPALGGEPRDLNMPYLVDYDCNGTCEWTREVISIYGTNTTWDVQINAPEDLIITVTPDTLPIIPGSPAQTLTITADVTAAEIGEVLFAEILLVPDLGTATRLPVIVVSGATPPVVSIDPTELGSKQLPDVLTTQTLTISNLGTKDLEWELYEEGVGEIVLNAVCELPGDIPWLSVDLASGITDTGLDSLVTVTFDSTGMDVGTYTATLCLSSNDPITQLLPIPVTLDILELKLVLLPLVYKVPAP